MGRNFASVNVRLFDDLKRKKLSAEDKLLMSYLVVNKHINMVGFDVFDPSNAAHDLELSLKVIEAGMKNLDHCGMIHFDLETNILFVRDWYKHNPIRAPKAVNFLIRLHEDVALPPDSPELALILYKTVLSRIECKRTERMWKRQVDFVDARISELEAELADDPQKGGENKGSS